MSRDVVDTFVKGAAESARKAPTPCAVSQLSSTRLATLLLWEVRTALVTEPANRAVGCRGFFNLRKLQ